MDIILVHLGEKFPPCLFHCIRQIRNVTENKILLTFSRAYNFSIVDKDVVSIYLDGFKKSETWKNFNSGHFNSMGLDLWKYACERFYAIETVMQELNINKLLHIENDNLIYGKPDEAFLESYCGSNIGIVPITDTLIGAGIMYIGSFNALNTLNKLMNSLLNLGKEKLVEKYGGEMLNEMRLLKIIQNENPELLKSLPIFPTENSDYVYDCASWGQYVGGTFHSPGVSYHDDSHIIGREINKGNYDVKWIVKDGFKFPYVFNRRATQKTPLFNLHIHSKELDKWMSK